MDFEETHVFLARCMCMLDFTIVDAGIPNNIRCSIMRHLRTLLAQATTRSHLDRIEETMDEMVSYVVLYRYRNHAMAAAHKK
uniref:Uncharacterized protein n=1 Tax=Anopheles minimus TaxID=112268 RepID=A0A182WP30_9DIPT